MRNTGSDHGVAASKWRDACQPSRPLATLYAEQAISIHQPGFAWSARMQAAPLTSARVLDYYVGGEGRLEARLFGSLPSCEPQGNTWAKAN